MCVWWGWCRGLNHTGILSIVCLHRRHRRPGGGQSGAERRCTGGAEAEAAAAYINQVTQLRHLDWTARLMADSQPVLRIRRVTNPVESPLAVAHHRLVVIAAHTRFYPDLNHIAIVYG